MRVSDARGATLTRTPAWVAVHNQPYGLIAQGAIAGLTLSFLVAIRAAGSVSGERERKTWDSLLLTPLDTWDLVVDKRTGAVERFLPHLVAYALPAFIVAICLGFNAAAWTVAVIIIAFAQMYYMASTGVWCSVKASNSWRSLFATIASGYGYGIGLVAAFGFVYLFLSCTVLPFVYLFLRLIGIKDPSADAVILTVTTVATVLTAFLLVRSGDTKVHYAKEWIDAQERYGRTITRSLTRALRSYAERKEQRRKQQMAREALAADQPASR